MEGLANKVQHIHKSYYDTAGELKKVTRRIDTLALYLAHFESYKQNKSVYKKYMQLDPKKRQAFYDKHADEIEQYEKSKEYLDKVMNTASQTRRLKSPVPTKDNALQARRLRKELQEKTVRKFALYDQFYKLRDDVKSVEILRRRAEQIMNSLAEQDFGHVQEQTQQRDRGIEL